MQIHYLKVLVVTLSLLAVMPARADSGFYAELQLGSGWTDTDLTTREGEIDLLFDPEDSGSLVSGLVGYRFDEHWFVNLGYQYLDADDTEVTNIVASANYRFWSNAAGWSAYAGVLGGSSELEWQDDPVLTRFQDRESEQDFFGGQIALEWAFHDAWQATLTYQYLDLAHDTRLDTGFGSGKYTHDSFQHLIAGLRYLF